MVLGKDTGRISQICLEESEMASQCRLSKRGYPLEPARDWFPAAAYRIGGPLRCPWAPEASERDQILHCLLIQGSGAEMLQVLVLSSNQNSRNYNPRRCSPRGSSNQRPGGHVLHFTTDAAANTKTPGLGFFFFPQGKRELYTESEPSVSMLCKVSSSGPTPAQLFLTGAQPWDTLQWPAPVLLHPSWYLWAPAS